LGLASKLHLLGEGGVSKANGKDTQWGYRLF
jgi:hypothetical protein